MADRLRIPLPGITQVSLDVRAHLFPMQVAIQTLELMQASIFHSMLADIAAGERVRQPNAIAEIEQKALTMGLTKRNWDDGWSALQKYQALVERVVMQNVLVALRSYWDWYIRRLCSFILASLDNENGADITNGQRSNLERVDRASILQQVERIEQVIGTTIYITEDARDAVKEMSLVRNLGLHNRWEVDSHYLEKTSATGWQLGDVRTFEATELQRWHLALINLVNEIWPKVAVRFKSAQPYPVDS